jgi:hypothetical protein
MFSVVELGTRTPPWNRVSKPASASRWTSRRTVCRVTPSISASCSTVTEPRVRTVSRRLIWRGLEFTEASWSAGRLRQGYRARQFKTKENECS